MIQSVKNFIEHNIDLIEKQNWEEVFKNWYIYTDDYYFEDLMDVLEVVEPNIWTVTWEARANVLRSVATNVFTNSSYKRKTITFESIGETLNSLFGFEGQDLITVLDQAALAAGLTKSKSGWHKV